MALQDILEKIKEQTENLLKDFAKQFEEDKKKLEETFNKKQKQIDERIHNKIEENKNKIIEKAEALAERERKNQILKAKHDLIEEAFDKAIEELSKSEKYEEIITDMLKKINIDSENTVIIAAKGKEEETKKAIKNSEKNYFLSDKSENIKGGFIVKTEKIEINNSFETIIKEHLRSDLEIKIHKLLFN